MLLIIKKIAKFKYYILGLFSLITTYIIYKFFNGDPNAPDSIYKRFQDDYKEQVQKHNRVTNFTMGEVWEKSELLAVFLGTHHTNGSYYEDEEMALQVIHQCNADTDDFFFLAGTYKEYHTEQRNLQNDLVSYLSSSDLEQISHIIYN